MLAVVMCLFDFVGSKGWPGRFEEAKRHHLDRGLAVDDVEVGMGPAARTSARWYIQATADNVIWQKERLWNLVAGRLPAAVDKIAFCDADVVLERSDWHEETCRQLEHVDVLQPFSIGAYPSVSAESLAGRSGGMTGLAWCCRRDWFSSRRIGGWYDRAGNCWGDAIFAAGVTGRYGMISTALPPAVFLSVMPWCRAMRGTRFGVVEGQARHLDHGSNRSRNYTAQCTPLIAAGYDPERDVTVDNNGLLAWAVDDPFLRTACLCYFQNRKDDDV